MKQPNPNSRTSAHRLLAPVRPSQPSLRKTFVVANPHGMHARPCALLIKTLHPFACAVQVEHLDAVANGRSLLGLMALAAGLESKLTFTMSGGDAGEAMAAVQRLFETQFVEAYEAAPKAGGG